MVDCEPALSRVSFDLHYDINFTDGFPVIKKKRCGILGSSSLSVLVLAGVLEANSDLPVSGLITFKSLSWALWPTANQRGGPFNTPLETVPEHLWNVVLSPVKGCCFAFFDLQIIIIITVYSKFNW